MKVLLINGSPHREGNTFIALSEVARTLESEGVQAEIVHIGTKAVQGCIACGKCAELGHCVFSDALYTTVREKLADADGVVVGSPVYYAGPNGSLCALLDRVFYSCGKYLAYKPGAAVAVCRRGGASATFDRLNKYFTIMNMPVVPSQYWNSVHGRLPGEAREDVRGAADDARAGPQHGPPAEGGRRSGAGARSRGAAVDAFYPVAERGRTRSAGLSASRMCTKGAWLPFFFVARTSSGVLPLYCPRIQRGAEKPEKISAGGRGFMEKNDNLPP